MLDELPFQSHAFILKKGLETQLFVPRASNPTGIAARRSFQFQIGVYVVDEMPTLASFGVVLSDLIFVDLIDFEYLVPLFHANRTSSINHVPV